ncbi:MAG: cysteine hydrolase family protein [Terriglobia bacterium]
MAEPRTIFWDVDTQVDFMLPGGKLYVPGAEKIILNLKALIEAAGQKRIFVVSSADAHEATDEEFSQYPPHCLAGTAGQQKVPETLLPRRETIPNRPAPLPALAALDQVVVEKQRFDVFTNPNIDTLLNELGHNCEFVLFGVVTEICVAHAARGLLERGYRLRLVRDAVKSLEREKAQALFDEVERRGSQLVTTAQMLKRLG